MPVFRGRDGNATDEEQKKGEEATKETVTLVQPTMRDVSKKFSVRYLLNLVLVDEGDRRYFKQQEATLWREADKPVRKILEPATVDGSANGLEDTANANVAEDHANGRDVTADDEQ